MKGSTKMADYIDTEQEIDESESLKFEHLLAEVRSVDNKDHLGNHSHKPLDNLAAGNSQH